MLPFLVCGRRPAEVWVSYGFLSVVESLLSDINNDNGFIVTDVCECVCAFCFIVYFVLFGFFFLCVFCSSSFLLPVFFLLWVKFALSTINIHRFDKTARVFSAASFYQTNYCNLHTIISVSSFVLFYFLTPQSECSNQTAHILP